MTTTHAMSTTLYEMTAQNSTGLGADSLLDLISSHYPIMCVCVCALDGRVLSLKDTGVDDESVRPLTLGVKHAHCQHLAELDVTGGGLGSLGATWLAGCTSKDSVSFCMCLSQSLCPSH